MPSPSEWPTVAIVLLTYVPFDHPERGVGAERTLRALLDNLHYSGPLGVHIADDGSPGAGYRERLRTIAGGYASVDWTGVTNAERGGYGRSYNLATQSVHHTAEYVMPIEDDWMLTRPLNLDPLVETLMPSGRLAGLAEWLNPIECIRLGYIGFTQRLRGEFLHTPAGTMILIDPDSPEPHVFAGHVRIETREFERRIGPWPEGLSAGATEFAVSHRPASRAGVAWPLDLGPASQRSDSLFTHTGSVGLGEIEP
jgi:hypothetical protein